MSHGEHNESQATRIGMPFRGTCLGISVAETRARRHWVDKQSQMNHTLHKAILDEAIDPVEHLRTVIANKSVRIQDLHTCLQAYFERHSQHRSHRTAITDTVRIPLARTILSYLFINLDTWTEMTIGRSAALLCYFALEEGLGNTIEDWIISDTKEQPVHTTTSGPGAWRGSLFRHLVEAHLMRASGHNLDPALHCFFRMIKRKDQLKPRGADTEYIPSATVSAWPAALQLCNTLNYEDCSGTDPELYSRFLKFYEGFRKPKTNAVLFALNCAALRMKHPTESTSVAALEFLRRYVRKDGLWDGRPLIKDVLNIRIGTFRKFLERTRNLALRDGLTEDAVWVEEQMAKLTPRTEGKFRIRRC